MPISIPGTGNTPQCNVAAANTVVYVVNGIFVVPPGVQSLTFALVGGGGGGATGPHSLLASIYNGKGGSAGAGTLSIVVPVNDTQYDITVGTGGAPGGSGGTTPGVAGTASQVVEHTTALMVLNYAGGSGGLTGSYDGVNYYPSGQANGGPGGSSVFGNGSIAAPLSAFCATQTLRPGGWGAGGGGSPARFTCTGAGYLALAGTPGFVQISWANP